MKPSMNHDIKSTMKPTMNPKVKHMLHLKEFSPDEVNHLVDSALEIKKHPETYAGALRGKTLAMIFQKTSTRTRISFEAAMTQVGGHAQFIDVMSTQFGMTDVRDEARCIARYVDVVMARVKKHAILQDMAEVMGVPLINGCDEKYHPCQALGDLVTIKEKKGTLRGKKVVYLGIANNVSNSLAMACVKAGADFVLCVPEKDPPSEDAEHLALLRKSGHYLEEPDVKKATQGADILYTDTWVNMEFFSDPKFAKEKERRLKTFMPCQVNEAMLSKLPKAFSMHCLPAHIGYEVDDYAVHGKQSVMFDQAENRLHAQKAIILYLLGNI